MLQTCLCLELLEITDYVHAFQNVFTKSRQNIYMSRLTRTCYVRLNLLELVFVQTRWNLYLSRRTRTCVCLDLPELVFVQTYQNLYLSRLLEICLDLLEFILCLELVFVYTYQNLYLSRLARTCVCLDIPRICICLDLLELVFVYIYQNVCLSRLARTCICVDIELVVRTVVCTYSTRNIHVSAVARTWVLSLSRSTKTCFLSKIYCLAVSRISC